MSIRVCLCVLALASLAGCGGSGRRDRDRGGDDDDPVADAGAPDGGSADGGAPDGGEGCGECDAPAPCEIGPGACNEQTNRCVYTLRSQGYVCRAAAGTCDVAERCSGDSPQCPEDALAQGGTVCRALAGPCDVGEETCDGHSPLCPVDACRSGTVSCSPGCGLTGQAQCNGSCTAVCEGPAEVCDDADNNCNGATDEGCAPDLVLDWAERTLHGEQSFDSVVLRNNSVLRVTPFDGQRCQAGTGTAGTGTLVLRARRVVVEPGSAISADGAGGGGSGCGEDNPARVNDSGAGGGYGGRGGSSARFLLSAGATYGSASGSDIAMGSNGSTVQSTAGANCPAGTTAGGRGGGFVQVECTSLDLRGKITAEGAAGEDGSASRSYDGAGGGSGGGILIRCGTVSGNGYLFARGGRGGNGLVTGGCQGWGAGGGGGGRVKIVGTLSGTGPSVQVTGGSRGTGYLSGSPGVGDAGSKYP